MSNHTITDYDVAFRHFMRVIGDQIFAGITRQQIVDFMRVMATEEVITLAGVAPRTTGQRSRKTLRNYHTALSALWTWGCIEGYAIEHVVKAVKPPKFTKKPIAPFTADELTALVGACKLTRPWKNKPFTQSDRATAARDRAIILLLIDTGLRNSELCALKLPDLDWPNGRIHVRAGKGDKSRYVNFGNETRRALRQYVNGRPPDAESRGDYLFVSILRSPGHPITRGHLSKLLKRIGDKAGVPHTYPHRFRHTAAVLRLKNGANAFQVREMLGHSSLDMTLRYINVAELNMDEVMKRTSPVDNLKL